MKAGWPFWLLMMTVFGVAAVAFSGGEASRVLKTPGVAVMTPLQAGLRAAVDEVGSAARTLVSLGTFSTENEQLRQRVEQLQSEIVRLQEAGEENKELRALVGFERENPGREYQPGRVIGVDPSRLVRSVAVNRGSNQGVQKGMVVVTHLGLVGKVAEVHPNACKVLLISDPSSVVNSVVQRTRVEGVATGRPDGKLTLQYVPKNADVQAGDIVISSGLGGGFPRGLLIGKVEQATSNDQDLFKTVNLAPGFVPEALSTVLFIQDFVPIELPRRN